MKKKICTIIVMGAAGCFLLIATSAALIKATAKGKTYQDVETIPHRKVGLVLGCAKYLANGRKNLFYSYRMSAAAALYKNGKVDYLLVSGDNHAQGYDETSAMKNSLAEMGVPLEKIYCDYAGFRTLDSIVRARKVFGEQKLTIISQAFHNERAIFIAKHHQVDAIGFNATDVRKFNGFRTKLREKFARVKTVLDLFLLRSKPRFLGREIKIGKI